jgi:hypothetical protein
LLPQLHEPASLRGREAQRRLSARDGSEYNSFRAHCHRATTARRRDLRRPRRTPHNDLQIARKPPASGDENGTPIILTIERANDHRIA